MLWKENMVFRSGVNSLKEVREDFLSINLWKQKDINHPFPLY